MGTEKRRCAPYSEEPAHLSGQKSFDLFRRNLPTPSKTSMQLLSLQMLLRRSWYKHFARTCGDQDLLSNFKRNMLAHLRQDVLGLTEEYSTPLLLLETIFRTEFALLPRVPSRVNTDLKRFGRRNLSHWMLPKSFYAWVSNKHREESWFSKHSSLHAVELHQIWIERWSTYHESTSIKIRIEDHETL